ncbi:hypothetical protein HYH03_003306 [Edaphochlamys debaryana]|uniref:Uncharacterized protein n=1 Tax=Edaphochlamys debaryana TaxID=47281 RepID=A0A835Y931_9CHLO|nr:hypothetical protein HYH03_003306 [Edaphochlamys debaryana]|eukprot:KAG2498555.1 hypothetical protein HYH03_003306 [Edaphochlamys debaryana]
MWAPSRGLEAGSVASAAAADAGAANRGISSLQWLTHISAQGGASRPHPPCPHSPSPPVPCSAEPEPEAETPGTVPAAAPEPEAAANGPAEHEEPAPPEPAASPRPGQRTWMRCGSTKIAFLNPSSPGGGSSSSGDADTPASADGGDASGLRRPSSGPVPGTPLFESGTVKLCCASPNEGGGDRARLGERRLMTPKPPLLSSPPLASAAALRSARPSTPMSARNASPAHPPTPHHAAAGHSAMAALSACSAAAAVVYGSADGGGPGGAAAAPHAVAAAAAAAAERSRMLSHLGGPGGGGGAGSSRGLRRSLDESLLRRAGAAEAGGSARLLSSFRPSSPEGRRLAPQFPTLHASAVSSSVGGGLVAPMPPAGSLTAGHVGSDPATAASPARDASAVARQGSPAGRLPSSRKAAKGEGARPGTASHATSLGGGSSAREGGGMMNNLLRVLRVLH